MPLSLPPDLRLPPGPLAHYLDSLLPSQADARLPLVDDDPGMIQRPGLDGFGICRRLKVDPLLAVRLQQAMAGESGLTLAADIGLLAGDGAPVGAAAAVRAASRATAPTRVHLCATRAEGGHETPCPVLP